MVLIVWRSGRFDGGSLISCGAVAGGWHIDGTSGMEGFHATFGIFMTLARLLVAHLCFGRMGSWRSRFDGTRALP